MPLTLADLDFLTSDAGAALLERLRHEDLAERNLLPLLTRLRHDFTAEQSHAALTMAQNRRKAADKFGDEAGRMYFDAGALQQASDPRVRRYRAQSCAGKKIVDAGCGIGADSLALAEAGAEVLGLDHDPVRIAIARLNADALGVSARFEVADVREGLPPCEIVFFDPARRDDDGRRLFNVEDYQPPLSLLREWTAPQIVVKLSPGVNLDQIAPYGGGVEFISVAGDLKEAVLWLGFERAPMMATLLTGDTVLNWPAPDVMPQVVTAEPRGWLIEPDPALLRAGLVQAATAIFDGAMLDETIAYFTTYTRPDSPWVRSWRVLDWMPFHLKRLRAYLRQQTVGQITVKKRGVAITPEELTGRLKLKGDVARTLVLTRYQGQPVVLICEPYAV